MCAGTGAGAIDGATRTWTWARTGATASSAVGMVTSAAVPPPSALRSSTSMPCRAASRATTRSPIVPASSAVSMVGRDSRALSSATCACDMPMPSSNTVRWMPSTARRVAMRTRLPGGENAVAFSSSSASRWIRSRTACAAIPISNTAEVSTRS